MTQDGIRWGPGAMKSLGVFGREVALRLCYNGHEHGCLL